MKRNRELCDSCVHNTENGYCTVIDKPFDALADDIMWEEDKKIFEAIGIITGIELEIKRPKMDRKLDESCPYILEQIVLRQKMDD